MKGKKFLKEVITTKKGSFQILIDFMILESAGSLNQNSSEFFGLLFSMAIFITIEEEVSTQNTSEKETTSLVTAHICLI